MLVCCADRECVAEVNALTKDERLKLVPLVTDPKPPAVTASASASGSSAVSPSQPQPQTQPTAASAKAKNNTANAKTAKPATTAADHDVKS